MHCITKTNVFLTLKNVKGVGITVCAMTSMKYCRTFVIQVYKRFFAVQVHSTANLVCNTVLLSEL